MRVSKYVLALSMAFAWTNVSFAQGQNGLRSSNTSNSRSGAVSQDLLAIYQQTKSPQTIESVTAIARACAKVLPDPARTKIDREYAASLLAWALNRRGEMRSEQAASLVAEGDFGTAEKLDRQASEDFKTAIEYGPPNWRTHHNYAIALAMSGDYQQGILEFTKAIELKPEYANAYFNRAELYFELGEYAVAVEDYTRAITANSRDPQYYNSRAHSQFLLEEYEAAVADYRQASELAGDSAVYLTDLADAYQFLGQWEEAAAAYQQAVGVNNKYARAYQNAAWLMATCPDAEIRNRELAMNAAQRALELDGNTSTRALDTLAVATANSGDFAEAAKLTRRAIQHSEDDAEVAEMKQRLDLYTQRRVYRQSGPTATSRSQPNIEQYRIRTASGNAFEPQSGR